MSVKASWVGVAAGGAGSGRWGRERLGSALYSLANRRASLSLTPTHGDFSTTHLIIPQRKATKSCSPVQLQTKKKFKQIMVQDIF